MHNVKNAHEKVNIVVISTIRNGKLCALKTVNIVKYYVFILINMQGFKL